MRQFLHVTGGFYREPYKPFKIETADNIEFRDSLVLSNMNLQKFCSSSAGCIHWKLKDTYDYSKIRTKSTPLSEEEEAYCYNDVRGLCECIAARMKDDTLASMPMTSTGYVRRDCRNAMRKNKKNRRMFVETQLSPKLYDCMKKAFRGGNTHASAARADEIQTGPVYSFDITSSYPAEMMTNYFPMGAFSEEDPKWILETDPDLNDQCYLFHILLIHPVYKGKSGIPYISKSKCEHCIEGPRYIEDNGRVRETEACDMWITEVDWKIIKETYEIFYWEIKEMYAAKKGYLPAEFKSVIMKYYCDKTLLKGSPDGSDDAYQYDRAKNRLNSTYGMCVTRIDNGTVVYDPEDIETPYNLQDPPADYLEKYYKSRNSFLPYQWGVWVTAHARMKLHIMLEKVGFDVCYCDTDSIKFVGDHVHEFEEINKSIIKKAEQFGAFADDRNGKRYYLGTWSQEETMDRFVTLGAKKYLADYGGKIKSTIAGVSKKAGADFFNNAGMEAFKIGTVIENSGHLVAYRNNEPIHKITVNYDEMTTASNMALVDDTYTLGVTDSYLNLLEAVVNNIFTWEVE